MSALIELASGRLGDAFNVSLHDQRLDARINQETPPFMNQCQVHPSSPVLFTKKLLK